MTRTHLITGVTGQDGALLARLLSDRGDRVVGTSMSGANPRTAPLLEGITVVRHDLRDIDAFQRLVTQYSPANIFNLAAGSSVAASWEAPRETFEVVQKAVERMLASLAELHAPPRFVQASSSEIFGPPDQGAPTTDEETELNPVSPYAEAKAGAHLAVRSAHQGGLPCANLVLFGHTSIYQAERFALPTIARQAAEVAAGSRDHVELNDPTIRRDWGSAHDVATAFADSLDAPPGDLLIATGELHSLGDIAGWALSSVGQEPDLVVARGTDRPNDFGGRVGNARKARDLIGWQPRRSLRNEISFMAETFSGQVDRTNVSPAVHRYSRIDLSDHTRE